MSQEQKALGVVGFVVFTLGMVVGMILSLAIVL